MIKETNYLTAVFFDYPEYTDAVKIKEMLLSSFKLKKWILSRFLEHGRVIDTLKFFDIHEIANLIDSLRLSSHTRKKWNRLIEVYGKKRIRECNDILIRG